MASGVMSLLEMELQQQSRIAESMPHMQLAITALAEDSILHCKLNDRVVVTEEDLRYALKKCRVYPFC
jgi:histone H3/H4